ncbi:MAG: O-methyltransferase [Devosia sp.]|nr:O-methyltransferase [Devosia sp.]
MSPIVWDAVDNYIVEKLLPHDLVLENVLKANRDNGLPAIDVSPAQGKLLNLMVRMIGARLVLEIGTLGAYSTIWMARGLGTGGRVVTLESEPLHATVARENIAMAGLSPIIEVRQGRAIDSLAQLQKEGLYPFDFIFIDADKPSNAAYLDWAVRLSRPGTVIVCDNVVRNGAVTDQFSGDRSVQGARETFDVLGGNPRLSATALQTVGSKGYDGFAMAVVGD